ncbi:hypothetical protein J5N97_020217 [Dioscorea zingiberensis]|uniref:Uncharacterized protein n=1 Tax=Dioscorea zingiberensis TaxID=325984 RepID=A0A9D5HDL6_9LILI|nr:hypothetical protein J5N97_020217 [Dioscorea zingiberensis]
METQNSPLFPISKASKASLLDHSSPVCTRMTMQKKLEKGVIVYICDSRGVHDIYETDGSNVIAGLKPLAVLVLFCHDPLVVVVLNHVFILLYLLTVP